MRKVLVAVGLVIVIIGAVFQFSPQAFGSLEYATGLSTSQVTYDHTSFLQIKGTNSSYISVPVAPQDNLSVQINASPTGVTFLLMNAGNFSEWKSGSSSSYSVYSQSKLNVLNYSFFFFADTPTSGSIYLVFLGALANATTSILVRLTVSTNTTITFATVIPLIVIVVGILILGVGIYSGGKKSETKELGPQGQARVTSLQTVAPKEISVACRFCGATLKPGSPFCPSCDKSQI